MSVRRSIAGLLEENAQKGTLLCDRERRRTYNEFRTFEQSLEVDCLSER